MDTSRHLKVVPGAVVTGASSTSPGVWRDIALALVIAVILVMGIADGALSPQPGAEWQIPAVQPYEEWPSAAQPGWEFVYFPAQYLNQATEIEDRIPTF